MTRRWLSAVAGLGLLLMGSTIIAQRAPIKIIAHVFKPEVVRAAEMLPLTDP